MAAAISFLPAPQVSQQHVSASGPVPALTNPQALLVTCPLFANVYAICICTVHLH